MSADRAGDMTIFDRRRRGGRILPKTAQDYADIIARGLETAALNIPVPALATATGATWAWTTPQLTPSRLAGSRPFSRLIPAEGVEAGGR